MARHRKMIDAKKIELAEYEKLSKAYGAAIEKGQHGESIDLDGLRVIEIQSYDKIISAMKLVPKGKEWTRYTNNDVLRAMIRDIIDLPCPDYTRYYGVRSEAKDASN